MTATFVDYAWAQFSPTQLKSMGFSGAMRYGVPGNSKSITPTELANLRTAGFDVGLVYETTANAAAQGFNVGVADAKSANHFADALGYPATCTLFYAVDFDGSPAQVQPYFDGVASVGGRPSAPYGGFSVVDGVRYPAPYAWQTVAWSAGKLSTRAGLLQNGFHDTYDSNRVLVADFGQWRATAPSPEEEDVRPIRFTHKTFTYMTDGVYKRWVGSAAESTFYDGKVVDWGEVPDEVFNSLVAWNAGPNDATAPTFPV